MEPHADELDDCRSPEQDTSHDGLARPTTHDPPATADAHAHAHAPDGVAQPAFAHEKLDAYRVACEMAVLANRIAARIPRGHRNIADHLVRSASNSVLLLAEGANRRGAASKRQRFDESRGECGEVAAAADLIVGMDLGPRPEAERLKALAGRVSAMLTGLICRLQ